MAGCSHEPLLIDDTTEDAAYTTLLSAVDPSDFGGALGGVFLADVVRRPLHFASAACDLSARQREVGLRAVRRAFARGDDGKLAPGDQRFADRAWQLNPLFRAVAESYL